MRRFLAVSLVVKCISTEISISIIQKESPTPLIAIGNTAWYPLTSSLSSRYGQPTNYLCSVNDLVKLELS